MITVEISPYHSLTPAPFLNERYRLFSTSMQDLLMQK